MDKIDIDKWAEKALKATINDWKKLGPELKKIRVALGCTASELATVYGITIPTVFRWESGKSRIPKSKIKAIKILLEKFNGKKAVKAQDERSRRKVNPEVAITVSERLTELGLIQADLTRMMNFDPATTHHLVTLGTLAFQNIKRVAEVLGLSERYLAGLVCEVNPVKPQKDVLPVLKKLGNIEKLTFEELEELILKPSENPIEQLQLVRRRNEQREIDIALSKLTEEQRSLICGRFKL